MAKEVAEVQPRREFLRLAALSGAAVLAGNSLRANAEPPNIAPIVDTTGRENKMEYLRVSGRHIVDAEGQDGSAQGNVPGRLDEHGGFHQRPPGRGTYSARADGGGTGFLKAQFFFERMLDYFFNEDDVIFLKKDGRIGGEDPTELSAL